MIRTLTIRTLASLAAFIFNGGIDVVDHTKRDPHQTETGSLNSGNTDRKKGRTDSPQNGDTLFLRSKQLYSWNGRSFEQTHYSEFG